MSDRANTSESRGFTLVELLLVVAIIALLASIAVPGLMRGRAAANEASAISSMRTLLGAQAAYASTCGGGGYASTLDDLALAPTAGGNPFIPADLGAAELGGTPKSGYVFTITGGGVPVMAAADTCNGAADDTTTTFFIQGDPDSPGNTGTRYFGADESGQIRQDGAQLADMLAGIPLQ